MDLKELRRQRIVFNIIREYLEDQLNKVTRKLAAMDQEIALLTSKEKGRDST